MKEIDLIARATRFEFCPLKVEKRSENKWAILYNGCCYDSTLGEFVIEPMPSGRTNEFLDATRFKLKDAIELAEAFEKDFAERAARKKE